MNRLGIRKSTDKKAIKDAGAIIKKKQILECEQWQWKKNRGMDEKNIFVGMAI